MIACKAPRHAPHSDRARRARAARRDARSPSSRASSRRYLLRLQLIKRLQKEHLPLAVIRERMAALTDVEIERATETPRRGREEGNAALEYVRSVLGTPSRNAATSMRMEDSYALRDASPPFTPPRESTFIHEIATSTGASLRASEKAVVRRLVRGVEGIDQAVLEKGAVRSVGEAPK